jgi:glycosyltransferase involved in cell wall biosynthesis
VIPNAVDVHALGAAPPYPRERQVILTGGRLEHYKNVGGVIEAVGGGLADVDLRILGDGPARPSLERMVRERGLQDRVGFLGRVDTASLQRWYRTAAVFVTLSEHEAFGIAPMEAVAAGAAVVASDVPAHRELAEEHPGARISLVPLDADPRQVATLLRANLDGGSHPPQTQILDWDSVAARTVALYRQVVAERPPGRHLLRVARGVRG